MRSRVVGMLVDWQGRGLEVQLGNSRGWGPLEGLKEVSGFPC